MRLVPVLVAMTLVAAACGADGTGSSEPTAATAVTTASSGPAPTTVPPTTAPATTISSADSGCADVVAVEVDGSGDTYTFAVTVASADTGWEKYADAWVVRALDGTVLGERVLTHPHVDEQPFTRSLGGVVVPEGTETVVVAARDSVLGFCGNEMSIAIGTAQEGG